MRSSVDLTFYSLRDLSGSGGREGQIKTTYPHRPRTGGTNKKIKTTHPHRPMETFKIMMNTSKMNAKTTFIIR